MTKWDKDHLGDIIRGKGDWFNAHLLRLIANKADRDALEKLHQIYPEQVEAVYERQNGRPFVPSVEKLEDHQRVVTMADGSRRVMGTGAIMP